MCIQLPPAARVNFFGFNNRLIGISVVYIRRWLAENQKIFGRATAHLGAVFAILRPPEAIGLIIFAHYIGGDKMFAEEVEAVLFEMCRRLAGEVDEQSKA